MPAVSVNTIIARARDAADMQDSFVTPTTWLRWFNLERWMLDLFIARSGYVLKQTISTIAADGSSGYDISDALVILGVYELTDSNVYRRLRHSDLMDGAGHIDYVAGASSSGAAQTFNIAWRPGASTNTTVTLYPIPTTGTYVVFYIVEATAVSTSDNLDTTLVYYPAGWEERIVLGMARRALAKEESPTGEVGRQILECERFIETMAFDRVFGAHQTVRNVDKVERGWSSQTDHLNPSHWRWV